MDRCVRQADTNLIWPERLGWTVFDPKHLCWVSEFVVDDSSHARRAVTMLKKPDVEEVYAFLREHNILSCQAALGYRSAF
jgi:hypothetical protein